MDGTSCANDNVKLTKSAHVEQELYILWYSNDIQSILLLNSLIECHMSFWNHYNKALWTVIWGKLKKKNVWVW